MLETIVEAFDALGPPRPRLFVCPRTTSNIRKRRNKKNICTILTKISTGKCRLCIIDALCLVVDEFIRHFLTEEVLQSSQEEISRAVKEPVT